MSVGSARARKATADGLSGTPETRPALNRPPQPEKHTPVPSGKGTQKKDKPEARAGVKEGATRLDRKQKEEWRKLFDGEFMVGAYPLLIPNAKEQDQSLGEEALRGNVA